jgi:hypothetical protein
MPFDLDVVDAHHGLPPREPDITLVLTDVDPPEEQHIYMQRPTHIRVTCTDPTVTDELLVPIPPLPEAEEPQP